MHPLEYEPKRVPPPRGRMARIIGVLLMALMVWLILIVLGWCCAGPP